MALEAYCDESGNGSLLFLAGFLSTEEKWERFRSEWKVFIDECPVKISYFHMTDCLATGERVKDSIFRDLSYKQRYALAKQAVTIARRWFEAGAVISVDTNEFDVETDPHIRKHWGDAYSFCCQACLDALSENAIVKSLPGDILYLFEQGGPKWERADKQMHKIQLHPILKAKYRYRNHLFLTKTEATPLQTPDILGNLAWKSFRMFGTLGGRLHPLMGRLASNPYKQPIIWRHFSGPKLRQVLADSVDYNQRQE
jgi:hypothetical protein